MPPMPPSSPPPQDPFAQYDPTGPTPPSGTGAKILAIVVVFVVLVVLLVGGIFLFTQGGDDDGDGEEASASASQPADDDEDQDEDDEFEDFSDDFEEEPDEPGGEPSDTAVDDTVPPPTTQPAEVDYLTEDTQPLIDIFADAVGPRADVVEVLVYEDYGFVTIRDPDRANRVQQYTYINGELSDAESDVPFPGTNLDTETFRLGAVAWDRLPVLAARAPERAGFPNGHVTHVIVDSDQPFSSRFLIRIYVTTEDELESDYLVATLDGRFTTR